MCAANNKPLQCNSGECDAVERLRVPGARDQTQQDAPDRVELRRVDERVGTVVHVSNEHRSDQYSYPTQLLACSL